MAQNTAPIFVQVPSTQWVLTSGTAVTAVLGTDANIQTVFTAGANGSRIENVYIVPEYASGGTAMTVRFWINNGTTPSTSANNTLIHEETMSATGFTTTAASIANVWNAQLVLPANYVLRVACAVASQAVAVTAVGGNY